MLIGWDKGRSQSFPEQNKYYVEVHPQNTHSKYKESVLASHGMISYILIILSNFKVT